MKTLKRSVVMLLCFLLTIGCFPFSPAPCSKAAETIAYGRYLIRNVGANKYLNIAGNSGNNLANVTLWPKDGTTGQAFTIYRSAGQDYALTPQCGNGRVVNVQVPHNVVNGANVVLYDETRDPSQTWIFDKVANGYIIRSSSNSGIVLTAAGTANGSNVRVNYYNSNNSLQIWELISLDNTSSTKLLSYNRVLIDQAGNQKAIGDHVMCGSFSILYYKAVVEGKLSQNVSYYWGNGGAQWGRAGLGSTYPQNASASINIINGKLGAGAPVIAKVQNKSGWGTAGGQHYVLIIGYQRTPTKYEDYIILDPYDGKQISLGDRYRTPDSFQLVY